MNNDENNWKNWLNQDEIAQVRKLENKIAILRKSREILRNRAKQRRHRLTP